MNEQVEGIVNRLNERRADSNFRPVFEDIRRAQNADPNFWRRHGEEINQRVDFHRLGFPEDFTIVGLNSRGQLITRESNNPQAQLRGSDRLRVQGNIDDRAQGELWGNQNRRFRVDEQGNAHYTARQGDNLWRIARDVLSFHNGYQPSESQVLAATRELIRANGANRVLRQGEEVQIPRQLRVQTPQGQERTAAPGARPEQQRPQQPERAPRPVPTPTPTPEAGSLIRPLAPVQRPSEEEVTRPENYRERTQPPTPSATAAQFEQLRPRNGVFNPIAPPGQIIESHRPSSPFPERPVTSAPQISEAGPNTVRENEQMVVQGAPRNRDTNNREPVTANVERVRDTRDGRILQRRTEYSEPINIRFDNGQPGGSIELQGVTRIHSRYQPGANGAPGTYETVVWTNDDMPRTFTLDQSGRVIGAPRR